MTDEFKGYKTIKKSQFNGYQLHVYEWDSPASAFEPKHAVAVELQEQQKCNIAIRTFTRDLISSMSLMDDKIETGIEEFDEKVLIYGECQYDVKNILTEKIREKMINDERLRMDVNPKVVVLRRFGAAEASERLDDDIDLSVSVAKLVDEFFRT